MSAGDWHEANQRYLLAALARVAAALDRHAGTEPAPDERAVDQELELAAAALPDAAALDELCAVFGLTAFERDTLLLCAGVELDSAFAGRCAAAQGGRPQPTFSLALASLAEPHWSALAPAAPLRGWRLVEVLPGDTLATSPLRIDERVLHHLTGVRYLDDRLRGIVEQLPPPEALPPSLGAVAGDAAALLGAGAVPPLVQLLGTEPAAARSVAGTAAAALGLETAALRAADVPASAAEREALVRLWEREALLGRRALVVEVDEHDAAETARAAAVLAGLVHTPTLLSAREPLHVANRPVVRLEVKRPTRAEQRALWHAYLGDLGARGDTELDALVTQFDLGLEELRGMGVQLHAADSADALWDACRTQARARLDDLAQRIDPHAGWDDLVLPAKEVEVLEEIAAQVRGRTVVYEDWGFAAKSARGLGISALFAGPSGTGKTMAAEVLAAELRLDLYRIDLSQVVSKYIGETEKNLRRVFDAAEVGSAILLFDEADALFGKRSDVRDSHDRYANIEISYLLQRMEAYRGLAILTTNMKSALDSAFLRRIRFIVQFPFPDAPQRAEIWRRIFPVQTPTAVLDIDRLARLNVAGGNIHNIALNAAFLAADAAEPVRMGHLLQAVRGEYAKLEKPLTEVEIGGWL